MQRLYELGKFLAETKKKGGVVNAPAKHSHDEAFTAAPSDEVQMALDGGCALK